MNQSLAGSVAVLSLVAVPAFAGDEGALAGALIQITGPTTAGLTVASFQASSSSNHAADDKKYAATRMCRSDADCEEDSQCYVYSNGDARCVPGSHQSASPVPLPAGCQIGEPCGEPPPVPSVQLMQKASELYVRERSVQLREELALGRGPAIDGLAGLGQAKASKLGPVLRTHRAELVALMGPVSDTQWAPKFLRRVEQLSRECDRT
jgi:hypothetical protein